MTGSGALSSPWRNPKIILILLSVFLCGAVAGIVGMRISQRWTVSAKQMPYYKEGGREISLQRFRKELDLTNEQAAEIEVILDDFMMYYQTLQAQMDEVRTHGKDRIETLLDDKQRAKFNKMLNELQTKRIH
ncbi:MAG TPA: hypothetical protein VFB63_10450 [Bryobacteraceae bacterium]|jgi:uncharacterized membrane protein|nr:hypothetical protein [Bryobacteraceae bacterium]